MKTIFSIRRMLSKFTAGLAAAALLTAGMPGPLAASAAQASGGAHVVITHLSSSHSSRGAEASAAAIDSSSTALQATLSLPGAWACFDLTVENQGSSDAVLSQVVQQDKTAEGLLVSFGISGIDAGEKLAPEEQCKVSIVVQLDPELSAENLSPSGDFLLNLVYDAADPGDISDEPDRPGQSELPPSSAPPEQSGTPDTPTQEGIAGGSPQTGESTMPLTAGGIGLCALVILAALLLKKRRRA